MLTMYHLKAIDDKAKEYLQSYTKDYFAVDANAPLYHRQKNSPMYEVVFPVANKKI